MLTDFYEPVMKLCAAIAANDMAAFDATVDAVEDLDAEKNLILRTCLEHDRFAMAKKLMMRGIASSALLGQLKSASERAHRDYIHAPSSDDRAELKAYQDIQRVYERLDAWKTTFDKDIVPILSLQKIEDLQEQIAALRREIAEVVTPARAVIKKTPGTPAP